MTRRSDREAEADATAAADRFRRLEESFRDLRDCSPADRVVPLARIEIEDPQLHAELLAMLAHDLPDEAPEDQAASTAAESIDGRLSAAESLLREIAGGPVDGATADADAPAGGESATDRHVGHYRLIRELGVGSSGIVHLAVDERNGREVALKLLHGLAAGPIAMARFRREAAILTRLDHPGIAAILEADATEGLAGPQCWIAMEPVHGVPVTRWVAAAGLQPREILELLAEIADAVAHAHERGVVHRDLKPANVLVTAEGRPRVLDLGAARLDRPEGTGLYTETGQVIGTVPYMAPEQFDGVPERIGPPCDVYALGVLGYRLLVGRLPLDVTGRPLAEAARIARDEEPSSLGSVNRALRGSVSAVIGTALEKDPARRYPDAGAMAADLRRAAAAEPVVARPPSLVELARRAARRNRRLLGTTVAAFVVLVACLAVAVTVAISAERLRRQEAADRADAEQRRVEADALRSAADAGRDQALRQAAAASLGAAESAVRAAEIGEARRQLERVPVQHRGWTWSHLSARVDRSDGPPVSIDGPDGLAECLILDDETVLVATHGVGILSVVRGNEIVAEWPTVGYVNDLELGDTPETVFVAGHHGVERVTLATGERQRFNPPQAQGRSVRYLPGRRAVVVGGVAGGISWHDADTAALIADVRLPGGGDVFLLEAAPDADEGSLIAVIEGIGGRRVSLDAEGSVSTDDLWDDPRPSIGRADGNDRGNAVATTWADGVVRVRRAPTWEEVASWPASRGRMEPILMLPDDSVVVAGLDALTWWTSDGRLRRRLVGHQDLPRSVEYLGDGRLVTVSLDGTLRRWDLLAPSEPTVLTHPRQARRAAFADHGRVLVTGGGRHPTFDGRVRTWDPRDGRLIEQFETSLREVHSLRVLDDPVIEGAEIVAAAGVGVAVWPLSGGPPRWSILADATTWSITDLHDGTLLAVRFRGRAFRISLADGSILADVTLDVHAPEAVGLPDGTALVVGRQPGEANSRMLRVRSSDLTVLGSRDVEHYAPLDIELLPGPWTAGSRTSEAGHGFTVAIAHTGGSVQIIDPATLETRAEIPDAGRAPEGLDVLFEDDGSWRLVICGDDRLLRLIEPGATELLESMLVHDLPVSDVAVSPDGRMIVTTSLDRTARIWHREVSDRRLVSNPIWPDAMPGPAWSQDAADPEPIADRLRSWLTTFADAARQRPGS